MRNRTIIFVVSIILASCGEQSDAKKRIVELARDPGAVQFRNITTKDDESGALVCGEFNETNQFGGYEGFVKFGFEPSTRQLVLPDPPLSVPDSFQPAAPSPSRLTAAEARELQWLELVERVNQLCFEAKL